MTRMAISASTTAGAASSRTELPTSSACRPRTARRDGHRCRAGLSLLHRLAIALATRLQQPRLSARDWANIALLGFLGYYAASFLDFLGLQHVGDAEARGLFAMLGQHVLIRFFADASGEIGVAAFALRPKWPGWLGWLLLRLSGKWKVSSMVECVSQFEDGAHLSTQPESVSPFEYGGLVQVERMPQGTPLEALVARHRERVVAHKAINPGSRAMRATDLEGMERRWLEGQKAKRAYRASIGYASDAELRQLLGAHHERLGAKVRQQLAVLAVDHAG